MYAKGGRLLQASALFLFHLWLRRHTPDVSLRLSEKAFDPLRRCAIEGSDRFSDRLQVSDVCFDVDRFPVALEE